MSGPFANPFGIALNAAEYAAVQSLAAGDTTKAKQDTADAIDTEYDSYGLDFECSVYHDAASHDYKMGFYNKAVAAGNEHSALTLHGNESGADQDLVEITQAYDTNAAAMSKGVRLSSQIAAGHGAYAAGFIFATPNLTATGDRAFIIYTNSLDALTVRGDGQVNCGDNFTVAGTSNFSNAVTINHRFILNSGNTYDIVAGTGLTANPHLYRPAVRVQGNGGAVTVTATPSIAAALDDQVLIIEGMDDTNTVTLQDEGTLSGSGLRLSTNTIVLGEGDMLMVKYNQAAAKWFEISRSLQV